MATCILMFQAGEAAGRDAGIGCRTLLPTEMAPPPRNRKANVNRHRQDGVWGAKDATTTHLGPACQQVAAQLLQPASGGLFACP